jgi:bacteriorhodopsin
MTAILERRESESLWGRFCKKNYTLSFLLWFFLCEQQQHPTGRIDKLSETLFLFIIDILLFLQFGKISWSRL